MRRLGKIEAAMALTHQQAAGGTQSALVVDLTGKASLDALTRGARKLFDRYALLRCRIVESGADLAFSEHGEFARISIEQSDLSSADRWEDVESRELHLPLDAAHSLWRLRLFSRPIDDRHYLMFVFHHAIVDADGARQLLRQLLEATSAAAIGADLPAGDDIAFSIPPALDAYLADGGGASQTAAPAVSPIPHLVPTPVSQRRTQFLHRSIDDALQAALERRLRQDRITIDAAHAAALALAIVSCGMAKDALLFKTAVSLRQYAMTKGASMDGLGCYIAVADAFIEVQPEIPFKQLAQAFHTGILKQTVTNLVKHAPYAVEAMRAGVVSQRDSDFFNCFGLTSTGELLGQRDFAAFRVNNTYNITNRVLGGAALIMQSDVFGGRVRMIYMFIEPLISREMVDAVQVAFVGYLSKYAEHEGA